MTGRGGDPTEREWRRPNSLLRTSEEMKCLLHDREPGQLQKAEGLDQGCVPVSAHPTTNKRVRLPGLMRHNERSNAKAARVDTGMARRPLSISARRETKQPLREGSTTLPR